MARKNTELDQLRATVEAKQKSVGAKLSRIKKKSGLALSGSDLDVRRDSGKVKNYSTKQLNSYLADMNKFMNPKVQYVADAKNKPLRKSEWLSYEILQTRYNKRVNDDFNKVANFMSPNSEESLQERMMNMTPTRQKKRQRPVNAPYNPPTRESTAINGGKALKILTQDMQKRLNPDFARKRLETDRNSLIKTLTDANQPHLINMVKELTPEQFATAWQFTDLANESFTRYETIKAVEAGNISPDTLVGDTEMSGVENILTWAKELPRGNKKKK